MSDSGLIKASQGETETQQRIITTAIIQAALETVIYILTKMEILRQEIVTLPIFFQETRVHKSDLFDRLEFHDSGLDAVSVNGSYVIMEFDAVSYANPATQDRDDQQIALRIAVLNVQCITEDGHPVEALRMRTELSTVLQFNRHPGSLELLLLWEHVGRSEFSKIVFFGSDLGIICEPRPPQPK